MCCTPRTLALLAPLFLSACNLGAGSEIAQEPARQLYDLQAHTLEGDPVDLGQYRGQVALVVNTASKCGYTPQYEGLQELYESYGDQNFVVLGFPSNDFLGQEPGTPADIRAFCTEEFGVTFPLFEKVGVKDDEGQSEIYRLLGEATGTLPSWNFGKYLIAKDGQVLQFFGTKVKPTSTEITQAIEAQLAGESAASMVSGSIVSGAQSSGAHIQLKSDYADFPAKVPLGAKSLSLNGSALCEWGLLGFNLYRGALYVERTSKDAAELMRADQTMLVYLHFVRKLSADQLRDAFRASVHYQVGENSPQEHNLQTLLSWMNPVTKGDAMAFVVDQDQALTGYRNGAPLGKIGDTEFSKLFIQLYLGNKPPTEALKKGMLGL